MLVGLEDRLHAVTDRRHAGHLPHRGADWGALLTAAGFAVGTVRVYVTSGHPLVYLVLAAAASLASVWCCGLLLRVFDLSSWAAVLRAGPLVAVYNLLLTPFVYPVVWALTERVPARPAQRW